MSRNKFSPFQPITSPSKRNATGKLTSPSPNANPNHFLSQTRTEHLRNRSFKIPPFEIIHSNHKSLMTMEEINNPNLPLVASSSPSSSSQSPSPSQSKVRVPPKRFVKNQIPDYILNDAALNAAISLLPSNYNFEVHKCLHRILSSSARRVALQLPEGLLMYSLLLSDIFTAFGHVDHCFVLGDVTYGACCVDDFSASALSSDLLIHYGHSCLVPVDVTSVPCLYVFVDIAIDVGRLVKTVKLNLIDSTAPDRREGVIRNVVLAGTIQFGSAIRAAKPELEKAGFRVLVPQAKPLSAGEVLGCTAPKVLRRSFGGCDDDNDVDDVVVVFVADGRFHLEAFMIANPGIRAFRYDPYIGSLFLEEYDHKGMKESRKNAIVKAREARNWGIVLGTLGRQGNTTILDRLEKRMKENGLAWTVVLMSEITPGRFSLFEDSVDAWIQIACPRLSIDWGDAFAKPLLTPFEAEIALGFVSGWWEKTVLQNSSCEDGLDCKKGESCCRHKNGDVAADYPMDYYAQDGGEWNSSYSKKKLSHPARRSIRSSMNNVAVS